MNTWGRGGRGLVRRAALFFPLFPWIGEEMEKGEGAGGGGIKLEFYFSILLESSSGVMVGEAMKVKR